tara:strand:+ start:325 stop:819 length:495 start_codon:yes stop_codon:yes gene_type:complete
MSGIKHLIECHCTLKVYQGREDHLYHKFPVYSKFDKNNKLISKLVQCNNCQTVHKVYDICKSDILRSGKDELGCVVTQDDISYQLPDRIGNILRKHECDISTWEHVLDLYEEESFNSDIVLKRDIVEGKYQLKILKLVDKDRIKIFTEIINDEIELKNLEKISE